VPLSIPINTVNAICERHGTEDSSHPKLLTGEKYSLLPTRDPILNPGPLGSPLRRDRHAYLSSLPYYFIMSLTLVLVLTGKMKCWYFVAYIYYDSTL
jgi:hypothetical protein